MGKKIQVTCRFTDRPGCENITYAIADDENGDVAISATLPYIIRVARERDYHIESIEVDGILYVRV